MFILRVLLRKPWLAALAFVALWVGIKLQGNPHWMLNLPGFLVVYGVAAFMILRFGLITLATGIFVVDLLLTIPITTNPASWYMGGSLFVLATVVAMTLWGGFTALGRAKGLPGTILRITIGACDLLPCGFRDTKKVRSLRTFDLQSLTYV